MTADAEDPTRRDILVVAASAFSAVGAASLIWPFIHQMNPDAGALALASAEFDLSPVKEGQAITVMWRGKPVFIRHRTAAEIEAAKKVPLDRSPRPVNHATPTNPAHRRPMPNRTLAGHENWLVMVGICTHLGCIPKGQTLADAKGDFGGWFCPCHGSHYDTAGRIRKGPAPRNLDIPPYTFLSDTKIRIG